MKYLLVLFVIAGLALAHCSDDDEEGGNQGADCCSCLVDNGCWGYDLCPQSTDCFCIYDDSYSGDCPANPCLAYASACEETNCSDECAGVTN